LASSFGTLKENQLMSISRFLLALACVVLAARSTGAADLTRIDRTIAKEPGYKTKSPKYCLLVFGLEAKTRVWLVLDGDALYVDRNANGDLTEVGERIVGKDNYGPAKQLTADGIPKHLYFDLGEITESDGKTKHRLHAWVDQNADGAWEILPGASSVRPYVGSQRAEERVPLADRPKNAPVLHFDGPLTLGIMKRDALGERKLPRSKTTEMSVIIGTPGLGEGKSTFVLIDPPPWDGAIRPVAEIEFPGKEPGAKPISTRLQLERCPQCNRRFYCPVRVPKDAGQGKAKITLSFPAWTDGQVVPATVEVPIVD
jgi:hypothetical protein